MGSGVEQLADPENWLVVDLLLGASAPKLNEGTVQYCDPRRPVTSIECVGKRHRWEIMLLPGDDPATFAEPENVWRLLSPWIRPDQGELERSVLYTFRAAVADRWRRGRLLLAGDAAHQTPPFLGQGLCAGIRDAANLAWKLAWVVRGQADESLLDTYEQEQSPHVRAFVGEAVRIGRIIQVIDEQAAARRDSELVARPQMLKSIRPSLGPGLHAVAPPAGTLSEQPILSTGRRMDDAVGMRFAVLGKRSLLDGVSAATRDLWRRADVALLPDEGGAYLASLGCEALIVRPDRYVLAVAQSPAELDAVSQLIPVRH
jgi:3-(3-hydroxy-phenyl)propionate hydroxylase